jgi:RecB family exonuclease
MLGGLAAALDLGPMPLADFGRLLATALASQEMDEPVPVTGSVRALGVLDARGLDFDVVYLLGLDDGTFPAPRRESPLLPDAMRREASRAAADVVRRKLGPRGEGLPLAGLLRTAREASLEDPFLFFLALSMAEREIVLSYPALNEQGNPTEPSPFLGEVAACLSEPLPERRVAASTVVPVATDAAEPAELVARAALDRWARDPHAPPDRLAAALAAALPGGEARIAAIDRRARIEERRSRWFLTAHDDPRKAALADAFVGRLERDPGPLPARVAAMTWSPTRLVELASCGFRFFAARILGLKPTEEAELGVVAREQGTLMHAVLRDFFTAHPTLPAGVDEALALGRAFVARLRAGAPPATIGAKDSALLDVAWEQMAVAVDEAIVLEHAAAGARPPGATVERLLEEPLAWTVAVPGGALGFEGRPDWIEVVREGGAVRSVRVLDYKASRSRTQYPPRLKLDRDLLVTGFQVPVYLLAALDRLGAAAGDAELAGGYLLPLANERPLVVEAFTRTDLAAVVGRIETLVAGAARGRFDVDPADCDQYCPYRAVCRYQPPPLEEDAGGD